MSETITNVEIVRDEKETKARGIENFLAYRMGSEKLDDMGREYHGSSFVDICRQYTGKRHLGRMESVRAAMETTDLTHVLANVANKSLLKAYAEAPRTFAPFVVETSVPDFKTVYRNKIGNYPTLAEVAEGDDFTEGTVSDDVESFAVKNYGKIISATYQLLVNDDLGAFDRMLKTAGYAVAELEGNLVWAQITSNPTMHDTKALFHADHGNLGTAATFGASPVAELKKLIRLQTGPEGRALNLSPRFLLVPVALEFAAEQLMGYIVPTATTAVQPNKFQIIADSRLDNADDNAYYLAADPQLIDTIELAKLAGEPDIGVATWNDFDSMAFRVRVNAVRGAKVLDYRGLAKNVGA